ncbi:MAG TPA: flavin reductase family protein [Actinomycetota bacterium]|nr:flavin reductase family protein [Actinomycetota bacterium]
MGVDPLHLRQVLSRYPTGVTIVGTRHLPSGVCGLTVNAFTSVSLEPPMVLVCVDRSSNTHGCIEAAGEFSVSVLALGQSDLAVRFAQKRDDKFDGVGHRLSADGLPLLDGASAWVEARVEAAFDGGDHTVFLAHVLRAEQADEPPLVFHRGSYSRVDGAAGSAEPARER